MPQPDRLHVGWPGVLTAPEIMALLGRVEDSGSQLGLMVCV